MYYVWRYNAKRNKMSNEKSSDPGLLILTSLAAGARHGYAIMEDVEQLAGVRLGPGTLYGALARLEERGWIEPVVDSDPSPTQQRRRPYRLTERGNAALREELERLIQLTRIGLGRLAEASAT